MLSNRVIGQLHPLESPHAFSDVIDHRLKDDNNHWWTRMIDSWSFLNNFPLPTPTKSLKKLFLTKNKKRLGKRRLKLDRPRFPKRRNKRRRRRYRRKKFKPVKKMLPVNQSSYKNEVSNNNIKAEALKSWSELSYFNYLPVKNGSDMKTNDNVLTEGRKGDTKHTIIIKLVPENQQQFLNYPYNSVSRSSAVTTDEAERRSGSSMTSGFGSSSGTLLLGLLPLLLFGGLLLGALIRSGSASGANTSSITNFVTINGTTVANTFNPNNTAIQNNTNVNNARRLDDGPIDPNDPTILRLIGVSYWNFLPSFLDSIGEISPEEIIEQSLVLTKKMKCVKEATDSPVCHNRVVCNHLSDNNIIFSKNVMLRCSEALLLLLERFSQDVDYVQETVDLMEVAESEKCETVFEGCVLRNVMDCINIF